MKIILFDDDSKKIEDVRVVLARYRYVLDVDNHVFGSTRDFEKACAILEAGDVVLVDSMFDHSVTKEGIDQKAGVYVVGQIALRKIEGEIPNDIKVVWYSSRSADGNESGTVDRVCVDETSVELYLYEIGWIRKWKIKSA